MEIQDSAQTAPEEAAEDETLTKESKIGSSTGASSSKSDTVAGFPPSPPSHQKRAPRSVVQHLHILVDEDDDDDGETGASSLVHGKDNGMSDLSSGTFDEANTSIHLASLSEEAKSPGPMSFDRQIQDLESYFRELVAQESIDNTDHSQDPSFHGKHRLVHFHSQDRLMVFTPAQTPRSRGKSMLDGVMRRMRRASKSSPSLPEPSPFALSGRDRTMSSPESPFQSRKTITRTQSSPRNKRHGQVKASQSTSQLPTPSALPPTPPANNTKANARADARAGQESPQRNTLPNMHSQKKHQHHQTPRSARSTNRGMPTSPLSRLRSSFFSRSPSKDSLMSAQNSSPRSQPVSVDRHDWWRKNSSLAIDLLTQSPSCIIGMLTNEEFSLTQRKQLVQEVQSLCLYNVDSDTRQQLLLMNLADELLRHEFRKAADSSEGGQTELRSSSSGAALFLSAYVRRTECERAANDIIDTALDPALDKNGPSSDPAILAGRILRKMKPEAFPVGVRLLCRQINALAQDEEEQQRRVSGFLVLKYINPILVAGPRGVHSQRQLIEAARFLQHLANHASSPRAITKSADLDEFLASNRTAMRSLLASFHGSS